MKKYSGFTLVELLITLFIVGILVSVGVPSLKSFMQSNQLVAATNELISAMHVARSEAIKANSRVTICSSDDGATCSGDDDWTDGWIVFIDANGDLAGTGTVCSAPNTDCLLRIHDGFTDDQLTVSGKDANSADITSFTFSSRGMPKNTAGAAQSGNFSICSLDSGGNTIGSRAVVLSLSGRVRVSDNTAVISCP